MAASGLLTFGSIAIGMKAGSTFVVAAGLEFLGDVLASLIVFAGMFVAAKPADEKHPYGYGRFEILAGLVVGLVLTAGGAGVSWRSLQGSASQEQMESTETQVRSAQLSVTNAEAEVQRTETHLREFLDVPLQEEQVSEAAEGHDNVPIKTPADGTVMERLANVGTVVSSRRQS